MMPTTPLFGAEYLAPFIHPSAEVEPGAQVGPGSFIWRGSLVRPEARIGLNCVIGSFVEVGNGVMLMDRCRVQNGAQLYGPAVLLAGVFIGPNAVIANDRHPKVGSDWQPGRDGLTVLEAGVSVGANATILPGVRIGESAVIGAGAVVTCDVPAGETWAGVPARRLK